MKITTNLMIIGGTILLLLFITLCLLFWTLHNGQFKNEQTKGGITAFATILMILFGLAFIWFLYTLYKDNKMNIKMKPQSPVTTISSIELTPLVSK
jgi:hypothetical protein